MKEAMGLIVGICQGKSRDFVHFLQFPLQFPAFLPENAKNSPGGT